MAYYVCKSPLRDMNTHFFIFNSLNRTLIHGACVESALPVSEDMHMSAEYLFCRFIDSLHSAGELAASNTFSVIAKEEDFWTAG